MLTVGIAMSQRKNTRFAPKPENMKPIKRRRKDSSSGENGGYGAAYGPEVGSMRPEEISRNCTYDLSLPEQIIKPCLRPGKACGEAYPLFHR